MTLVACCALASTAVAADLQVSTQPGLYPAFDPAVSDYVVRCTSGTPVDVTVSAPEGTEVDVDRHGGSTGDFSTAVGLNPGQAFTIHVASESGAMTYFVRCLPADFPSWTYQRADEPGAEWYMADPVNGPYGIAFDGNGVPVWWLRNSRSSLDFRLLPNGNVVFAQNGGAGDNEYRLDGTLVRTVRAAGSATDPHEIQLLPNGNYLVVAQRTVPGQALCGRSDLPIADNGVQEIGPDGSLIWSWWASEHIPLSEIPTAWCPTVLGGAAGNPKDAYHLNSIEPTADGYLVSFRHLDAIYNVDEASGAVSWKLGGVPRAESLTVLDDPLSATGDTFRGQHDARLLPDGSVTAYDNGFHPAGDTRRPRAVRFVIEPTTRIATLVEEKTHPGTVTMSLCCGSARKLAQGDWVINWGSSNLVTELDALGAHAFSLTFGPGGFSYRVQPVAPGVVDRVALRRGMDAQFPRGYSRPRGAVHLRAALVPAEDRCTSPNATHRAPMAYESCKPPATSSLLTVGTPDSNGRAANSVGFVSYVVRAGDPATVASEADVSLQVELTDVRWKSDLSDYTGSLQLRGAIRITDRSSGAAEDEAATVSDTELPVTVPCVATPAPGVGATCSVSSTLDALAPGTVVEGRSANWGMGSLEVFDGGASGAAGSPDAQVFERQGLFVP